MKFRQWMIVAVIAGLLAGGVPAVVGCKRKPIGPPTIKQPPRGSAPTTEEVLAIALKERMRDFDPIPPLLNPKSIQTPDGESWTRYDNGIMIQELRIGIEGMPPRLGQKVAISYIGTIPGTNVEFDRSSPDKPLEFELGAKNQVIQGMSIGVSTMHVNGKRRIFIPSELAYGVQGRMPKIQPDQALIFQVELLSISGKAIELPPEPKVEPAGPPAPATSATAPAK